MGYKLPPGPRLPLDWFTIDMMRHLVAHRMRNLATMMVLAERLEPRNVQLGTHCLLCARSPDVARHLWECPV